jgi:hypothetical protein
MSYLSQSFEIHMQYVRSAHFFMIPTFSSHFHMPSHLFAKYSPSESCNSSRLKKMCIVQLLYANAACVLYSAYCCWCLQVECTLLCDRGIHLYFTLQLANHLFFTLQLGHLSILYSAAGQTIYSLLCSWVIYLFFTLELWHPSVLYSAAVVSIYSSLWSCGIHLFFTLQLWHPFILYSAAGVSIYSLL